MYNPIEAKRRFVQDKIHKSFDSVINIADEKELEKAWSVGDEKQYQGVTYYVGGFNAKGQPLWRKKKDGSVSNKKAGASTTDAGNDSKTTLSANEKYEFRDTVLKYTRKNNGTYADFDKFCNDLSKKYSGKIDALINYIDNLESKAGSEGRQLMLMYIKQRLQNKNNNTSSSEPEKKIIPAPRKPGSTNEIERMTTTAVHNAILGLNNTGTNVKDKGDHFLIEFDANDFYTHGQRSPQIDRIAKFLESMGASCVIGKNEIKAYKKVEAKKNTTSKTQSSQDKVKDIMQQFDDTTMDEDEFDEYVDSVLGNDVGQKLRKEILNGNKSFSDKKQAYKDAVEKHLGLKPQKYSNMDIKDAKKALVGKVVTLKDYWPDGRGGSQDAVGEIKNVRLYGKDKLPIAEISYPNGDEQLIRLDEIDDGKMKDSYKTPIVVGDDKTHLDAVKKKIADINSDPRDKVAHDAGFKDYEEMKGYQDYVTQKNLLKKRSTSAGMRLLYQQEIDKYERDHADLIKRIGKK